MCYAEIRKLSSTVVFNMRSPLVSCLHFDHGITPEFIDISMIN